MVLFHASKEKLQRGSSLDVYSGSTIRSLTPQSLIAFKPSPIMYIIVSKYLKSSILDGTVVSGFSGVDHSKFSFEDISLL